MGRKTEQDSLKTRRKVYRLRDIEKMSYNQIMRKLGISKATVQYYLRTREKPEQRAIKDEISALW